MVNAIIFQQTSFMYRTSVYRDGLVAILERGVLLAVHFCCVIFDAILGVYVSFSFEPSHEIMVLFVLHRLFFFQTRRRSYPVRLDV